MHTPLERLKALQAEGIPIDSLVDHVTEALSSSDLPDRVLAQLAVETAESALEAWRREVGEPDPRCLRAVASARAALHGSLSADQLLKDMYAAKKIWVEKDCPQGWIAFGSGGAGCPVPAVASSEVLLGIARSLSEGSARRLVEQYLDRLFELVQEPDARGR